MHWDVAGIGNALMDALVILDDEPLVREFGLTRGTMHLVDHARWTEVYARVQTHGVVFDSGGSCANAIATVGRLGGRSVYYGQVGQDQMGKLYASNMERACGAHRIRFSSDNATGKCLSIISSRDAERTMLTDLGAAVRLPELGSFTEELRRTRIAFFEGYMLLDSPTREVVLQGMRTAKESGALVALDASDPFVVGVVKDLMWQALRDYVDVVFLNHDESKALTGIDEAESAARSIASEGGIATVAVKLGAAGSIVVQQGSVVRIGIIPVKAIDTTGAGDAYAGGFLYALSQGWSAEQAGHLGSAVAALAVSQVGAVVKDGEALSRAVAGLRAA